MLDFFDIDSIYFFAYLLILLFGIFSDCAVNVNYIYILYINRSITEVLLNKSEVSNQIMLKRVTLTKFSSIFFQVHTVFPK